MIAYRLQAERLGDPDRDTLHFLDQVGGGDPQWRRAPGKGRPPSWPPSDRHIGHDAPVDNTELITTYVRQIEVRRTEIAISLRSEDQASEVEKDNPLVLTMPWSKTPHRRHRSRRLSLWKIRCLPSSAAMVE
jgi:hypothetical protein